MSSRLQLGWHRTLDGTGLSAGSLTLKLLDGLLNLLLADNNPALGTLCLLSELGAKGVNVEFSGFERRMMSDAIPKEYMLDLLN